MLHRTIRTFNEGCTEITQVDVKPINLILNIVRAILNTGRVLKLMQGDTKFCVF